jgi:hypothetical protein
MSDAELSWDALAVRLGVSRQSIVNWRNLEGAPKDRDPDKWKEFIATSKLGARGPRSSGELKDEKTRHEIEILKAKLAREKRTVIPAEEVQALLLHLSTQSRTVLYQFMETEAPPKLDGMSAAQMRPILREMADSICEKMGDLINDFETR